MARDVRGNRGALEKEARYLYNLEIARLSEMHDQTNRGSHYAIMLMHYAGGVLVHGGTVELAMCAIKNTKGNVSGMLAGTSHTNLF